MTKANKVNAVQSYASQHAEVVELLAGLQVMIQNLPTADGDNVHWGHVGNVGYVAAKLREVNAFLQSIETVREIAKHEAAIG